jgi:hypothetical protein
VDSRNAHAWPELYFNGVGWVRFEPTPSRGVVPDYAQTITSPFNVRADDYDNLNPGAANVPPGAAADPEETSAAGSADPAAAQSRAAAAGTAASAGLLLALLPLSIRSARTAARRRRVLSGEGPGAAAAAWSQTTEIAGDYGHPALPTDTPRAFSQRLRADAGLHGPAAASLERLQRAFEREEYAGPEAAPAAGAPVALLSAPAANWDDVGVVTAALRERSSLPARLRARFLPRSLLRPTR